MTRRIVQLAGSRAEFALADDGSIWLWTPEGWKSAERGPLPGAISADADSITALPYLVSPDALSEAATDALGRAKETADRLAHEANIRALLVETRTSTGPIPFAPRFGKGSRPKKEA